MTLAFAPLGREMTIKQIDADEKVKRHLENLGMYVGSPITSMFDSDGNVVLKIKDGRVALNRALAMKIIVA
ncbi:MAG: ferrous iron transport protein A [Clostridiales bacterium]|jgi:ferrous iron transport protein A|nr:ferrous iron transport protein A [Clostridiales bacterium]